MNVNGDGWMKGLRYFCSILNRTRIWRTYPEAIPGFRKYPSRRGAPQKIVPYMAGDQDFISPIMSNPENVYQLGPNAYAKPATALNILRETVMGERHLTMLLKPIHNDGCLNIQHLKIF